MTDPISEAFGPLFGRPSWNLRQGIGSFITAEFGSPSVEVDPVRSRTVKLPGMPERVPGRFTSVHGEWHLWIYCCVWTLQWDGHGIAHCESRGITMSRALGFLGGQALSAVTVSPEDGSTVFEFDLGCVLETWPDVPAYGRETEQWMLFQPSGLVLTVRDDGRYRSAPASQRDDDASWLELPSTT